ncbi:MAG: hypothetical protein AB9856_18370 [Cellulosilyticaceae bacterium]
MFEFRDCQHEAEFKELLEQGEINEATVEYSDDLTRRQILFLYLIAMYQEDYLKNEGCKFYLEAYEELEIGGPTYLLEDEITLSKAPHEAMLKVAKQILKGEAVCFESLEKSVIEFTQRTYLNLA